MGTQGVPLDKNAIIEAIYLKKGYLNHAADYLGCCHQAIYQQMKIHPDIGEALEDARAIRDNERKGDNCSLKDKAYKSIDALLEKGDVTSTIFILKTLCGFDDKQAQQHIQVRLVEPLTKRDSDPA